MKIKMIQFSDLIKFYLCQNQMQKMYIPDLYMIITFYSISLLQYNDFECVCHHEKRKYYNI